MDHGAGPGLVACPDRGFGLGEQLAPDRWLRPCRALRRAGTAPTSGSRRRGPCGRGPPGTRRGSGRRRCCAALPARARFRQALAESQAWTPMRVAVDAADRLVGAPRRGRPLSRRINWLAARQIASPMAAGSMPSARAAAAASAACSGVALEDGLAHLLDPGVLGRSRAQRHGSASRC